MSVSKKIRFEVFKRDRFACQYCGATPPAIVLEIDHIIPKSKNGKDDIDNLITSCFDCNRGKSNNSLSSVPKSIEKNLSEMKAKEEQIKEYENFLKAKQRKRKRQVKK